MDGIHDLGGAEGFGPVEVEVAEPTFHFDWERRALGLTMSTFLSGLSNGGQFRHSVERMDPVHYLTSRYYEHWITGVATRAVETGVLEADELEARAGGPFPLSRPVAAALQAGDTDGAGPTGARFGVGDRVIVRQWHPRGHTRCPRYVRGKPGTVVRVDPSSSVPDIEAHRDDRRNEAVYCVRFGATDLWGEPAEGFVHVDLWESYLS